MKAKIEKKENKKEFEPFDITITVENVNEARVLFHFFNNVGIDEVINERWYVNNSPLDSIYTKVKRINTGNIYDVLKKEIIKQGFDL